MRLRTPARHAAPRSWSRPERTVGLLASSTAVVGALSVAATLAAVPAALSSAEHLAPVAVEIGLDGQPVAERPASLRASRDRSLAGDDDLTGDPLPDCAAAPSGSHPNGQLPAEALCALPGFPDHKLRPDAARAYVRMSLAFAERFGSELCFTDTYRSLGSQQALAARKPGLAARPGTSEHGWGLAMDFGCGVQDYDTPEHRWMMVHADRFGWGQPDWAKKGGARQEPWHWEYLAAGAPSTAHDD